MSVLPARAASAAQRGVSLIELIAFIVIMGISVVALLSMYRAVLPHGATSAETLLTKSGSSRTAFIFSEIGMDTLL